MSATPERQRHELEIVRKPPVDWYEGVGITWRDDRFRPKGTVLTYVLPSSSAFREVHNGVAEHHYGMWRHLGGPMPWIKRSQEQLKRIGIHAAMVEALTGFAPKQIAKRAEELRDQHRYASSFPFPVHWAQRYEQPSHPLANWFIGFKHPDGTVLVRLRRGFMRRSGVQEQMEQWYACERHLRSSTRHLSFQERKELSDSQQQAGEAIETILGFRMLEIETTRQRLEHELVRQRPKGLNVKQTVSLEELKQQDMFDTLMI